MLKFLTIFVLLCSTAHCLLLPPTHIGDVIRDLYYASKNAGDMMIMANDWTVVGLVSSKTKVGWCGLYPVLGGSEVIGSQGSFSRTYKDLVNHNIIYFDIGVKMIGNWKDNMDTLTMKVDGSTLKSITIFRVGDKDKTKSCGNTESGLDTRLVGHFYHSASSVTISLAWDLSSSSELSFAIADVSLIPRSLNKDPTTDPANALLALSDTLATGISPRSEDSGKTNCPSGYYNDGLYCFECNAACQDCYGPSSSECYSCQWGYGFDGNKCSLCNGDDCGFCSGGICLLCNPGFILGGYGIYSFCYANEYCIATKNNKDLGDDLADPIPGCSYDCNPGTFMLWNNTCVSSCDPPLIHRRQNDHSWCDYPCSLNEYLMPDGRCLSVCPSGFSVRVEALHGFCDLNSKGCGQTSLYRYQNGSCLPTCPDPYIDQITDEGHLCSPPCPQGYFDLASETCVKRCEPEYTVVDNGISYCESSNSTSGCPNMYTNRYSNGSCIDSACEYPFQQRFEGAYFCDDPCPENHFFHSWEKRCVSSCKSGNIRVEGVISYCDPEENCRSKSDFRHPDGSCKPDCPYPHDTRINEEGYQFCDYPCASGQYFHSMKFICVETCSVYFIGNTGPIDTCSDGPETPGCPSSNDYRYPNGSCLSSCEAPFSPRDYGSYFCDGPCGREFGFSQSGENWACTSKCKRENVRLEGGILYCDPDKDDGNWCPTTAYGRFSNGTCSEHYPPWPFVVHESETGARYAPAFGPCPNRYFIPDDTCSDTCRPENIRVDGVINWCDGNYNNGTNSTTGCPNIYDYKYPNGSCLPSCPYPYREEWNEGSYLCQPPCPLGYFNIWEENCVDSCEPESIRFEDEILYCDGSNNGTNSTNSTTGCPNIDDFKYQNGSCLPTCPYPYNEGMIGQERTCSLPCPAYLHTLDRVCLDYCEPEYVRFEDNILYCDGHADPNNNGTNSTNSTIGCPNIYDYKYPNGSCLSSCPYPHRDEWLNGSYFCYPPCPNRYFNSLNEQCIDSCEPEYIRFEDDILYCDGKSDPNNGTNNTNSTGGCPNTYDFKYPNGSCLSSCPYPHKEAWQDGSYFCNVPCSQGYFDTRNESCVDDCKPEYTRFEDDILYCDGHPDPNNGTNSTNSTIGCPNVSDFKYPNGSCLSSCPFPRRDEWHDGSYFCSASCYYGYFDTLSETCIETCEPEYVRFEDDILYCDGSNNSTNSTNSTTGCPNIYDFKYPNGSCLSSCPYPRKEQWHDGSYFCYPPCIQGFFDIESESCVDRCEPRFITYEDRILYCVPSLSNSSDCTIDYAADGSATTNCTDPSGLCHTGSFIFEDASCNETCPAEFTPSLNASCTFPCDLDGALYPDGSCSSECSTGYTLEMFGNFQLCVKDTTPPITNYTVTVGIYIRYDIPLADFNSLDYRIKFINLLADLLGVDPSEIIIISIKEGSTIIDAKVQLTSDSSDAQAIAANKAKAATMNGKFENAVDSKSLDLDGVGVLNSKVSIITPEGDQDTDKSSAASSSSSSKIIVLIAIIAIVAVAIAIAVFAIYRFKVRRSSLKVVNLKRAKEYSIEANQAEIEEKKRDEEMCILNGDNSRIHDGSKFPTTPAHVEEDQDAARKRARALAQEKLKEMQKKARVVENQEVEKGKPVSLNEIMKVIDE